MNIGELMDGLKKGTSYEAPLPVNDLMRKAADVIEAKDEHITGLLNTAIEQKEEIDRLRGGLNAAISAANLALFVIRKQGVMPNSSWQGGFEKDMATAEAARSNEQIATEKDH